MGDPCLGYFDMCDVAIPSFIGSVPIPFFTSTERSIPGRNIPEGFVCHLSADATGFVAAKCRGDWKFQNSQVAGLILTAAHSVINLITGEFIEDNDIYATFHPDRTRPEGFEVIPLYSFTQLLRKDIHYSETTKANYPISNDIAVCLLIGNPNIISEVNFINTGEELKEKTEVLVSGHPKRHLKKSYIYPSALRKVVSKDLTKHFFQYSCQINSHGKVKNASDSLLEITCSATSGMSGSPILVQTTDADQGLNNYSIAGIYVGGPPIPGQFELYELCKSYYQGRSAEQIISEFRDISSQHKDLFVKDPFRDALRLLSESLFEDVDDIESMVRDMWFKEVMKFKPLVEGNMEYYYNTAIPAGSESFKEALRLIELFKIKSAETILKFEDTNEVLKFIYQ